MTKTLLALAISPFALLAVQAHAEPAQRDTLVTADAAEPAAAPASASAEPGIQTTARDYWGDWGIDLTAMDPAIRPGDDFNHYANGAWLREFELPADRARYGGFTLLAEKSEQRVRKIIDELAAANPAPTTAEGKVSAYYNAYMDVDAINAAGLAPAQPYLDRIAAVQSHEDLSRLFATPGFASPFGGYVDVDSKQPDQYIFYVGQSGLGLPDRDYYLVDSEKNVALRAQYKAYLTFLLDKAGYADAAAAAEQVDALEEQIARAHWDRGLSRNDNLTYNLVSRDEFIAMAGDFPLAPALETMGLGAQPNFVIREVPPSAEEFATEGFTPEMQTKLGGGGIPAIFAIAQDTPVEIWRAYLTAHFLSDHADVLPSDIDAANFELYGKALSGQQVQRERWKRAVASVEGAVGEALGQVYAQRYFPEENKAAMDELVANLRAAMAANLTDIDWMSDTTKVEARDKLAKFTPKIGFPATFETYDSLTLGDGALANAMAAGAWAMADNIGQLGQPIDKDEWFMLPQTVNAYYAPNRNEIVFPAAILQPPFFNLTADPAVNYGAIGAVIGHEMGHGFDDQGSKSDGDGVLRDWWTAEDKVNFEKLTAALVAQYSAICPLDDGTTCINGQLTLGENIGDVGGLSMAYRAYKLSLNGQEAPVIDGLSGDQRFFLAWAQVWRNKAREEYLRTQLQTDPHSPADYRINGVVRNFDEWYDAFGITPEDDLYLPPEQRVRIW